MKRAREADEAAAAQPPADASAPSPASPLSEDDNSPAQPRRLRHAAAAACPFLDTVNRAALDFDFEKCCSVTLSPLHCYACLVCGKYFQGRGPATVAYTHALEAGHHVFMKLADGRVYCLPDGYEVLDRSLDDIRHVLDPRFGADALAAVDTSRAWSSALDGSEYLPGVVGLNNVKATDYVNVVLQALMRVKPLRDALLRGVAAAGAPTRDSPVLQRFGELTRKVWNPRNFKGQVSPHEFLQAVVRASNKRFLIDRQGDPVEFLAWFLHELHRDLGGTKQPGSSIVDQALQGQLRVTTQSSGGVAPVVTVTPFYMLGLDLPPPPLFQDVMEKSIIPQVALSACLSKYDGATECDVARGGRKTYAVDTLPPYLILHMKRFTRNNFFVEKNPTIVTFPVRNLELRDALPLPPGLASKYDLVANVCHDGKPGEGAYRAQVHHAADGLWYEMQDLSVTEVLPQQVALSECYIQIYERSSTSG